MRLEDHPTVKRLASAPRRAPQISASELRQLALDCGAADVGLVEISRPALFSRSTLRMLRITPQSRQVPVTPRSSRAGVLLPLGGGGASSAASAATAAPRSVAGPRERIR